MTLVDTLDSQSCLCSYGDSLRMREVELRRRLIRAWWVTFDAVEKGSFDRRAVERKNGHQNMRITSVTIYGVKMSFPCGWK